MKNKKLLAVAIAATLSAGAAQAGTLAINNVTGKSSQFATHIWDVGSEVQQVYLPDLVYVANAAVAAGTEIRFNLLDGAIFGDVVTADHFVVNAGGNIDTGSDDIQIVSGGAIGNFHVTVKLTEALVAGDTVTLHARGTVPDLDDDTYANFAAAVVAPNTNVEIKEVKKLGVAGTTIAASVSIQGGIDQTASVVIAHSFDPLKFTTTDVDSGATLPNTINMADSDLKFSVGAFSAGGTNALTTPGQLFNHAGTIKLEVTTNDYKFKQFNGTTANAAANIAAVVTTPLAATSTANVGQISDPAGNQYAPDGADTVALTLTAGSGTGFSGVDKIWVQTAACTATPGGIAGVISAVNTTGQTATFNYTNATYGSQYNVCALAKGTVALEPQTFKAAAKYENAEPTYQDKEYTGTAGTWIRNGCAAAFFNVTPANGTAADETFLRLTNTTGSAGPVRVRAWAQDGTRLGTDGALLQASLAGHATSIFTPEQVQSALGVAAWTGRARVVLFGGFNSCVGQNMTRAGGVLINSTPTTDGNNDGITPATTTNSGN